MVVSLIFFVAFIGAAEFGTGIRGGLFCAHADSDALEVVAAEVGRNTTRYQMAEHYITGGGHNPMKLQFQASGIAMGLADSLAGEKVVELLGNMCDAIKDMDTERTVKQVNAIVSHIIAIAATARMHSYYRAVMLDGVCSGPIESFGWLVSLELLVGLVGLPLVGMAVHRYMHDLLEWEDVDNFEKAVMRGDTNFACETAALLGDSGMVNSDVRGGKVPLTLALDRGASPEVLQSLLDARAELEQKDGHGETAVEAAARNGNADFLRLAGTRGAKIAASHASDKPNRHVFAAFCCRNSKTA